LTIHIDDLEFFAIVGILKDERTKAQRVVIDCVIQYKKGFIDYADVASFLKRTMREKEFGLLEDAIVFLADSLKKIYDNIEEIELKITKPDILSDCKVAVSKKFKFC